MRYGKTITAILFALTLVLPRGPAAMADTPVPCIVPFSHPTIQSALDDAALGNCEDDLVTLLPGIYFENILWPGIDGITLRGYPDSESETIINGGFVAAPVITFDGTEDSITPATLVTSLAIRNGAAVSGGGIYCFGASPAIEACTITECLATYGGGIYAEAASPVVSGCTIEGNTAFVSGGGIYALSGRTSISQCSLVDNEAVEADGGGIWTQYSATVVNGCKINGNRAGFRGAGIFAEHSAPEITGNEITGNSGPSYYGGGIASRNCTPVIDDNVIHGNDGGGNGGGLFY